MPIFLANFLSTFANTELFNLLSGLLIAGGIGLLIRLEREYAHQQNQEKTREELFAGIRTFPIIAFLGFMGMFLTEKTGISVFIAVFTGVILMVGLGYYLRNVKGIHGGTTELTALLTFLLGGMVFLGYYRLSIAIGVLVTLLLAFKDVHSQLYWSYKPKRPSGLA